MHVSLDSALGRQRRLNSVGESALQIASGATAAYSLRSLTGGDPKVVRVRRASDNHEQDFTASGVSSGALTSFVNAQVTPPLDIQELSATGRDGDFLIAKAAYSLRSLGTRQATLAATGDTVARADGKFVCQVRRDSDDAVKSFTATEITDGTLLAFVNTGVNQLDLQDETGSLVGNVTNKTATGFDFSVNNEGSGGYMNLLPSNSAEDGTFVLTFDAVLNSGSFTGVNTRTSNPVQVTQIISGANSITYNVASGSNIHLDILGTAVADVSITNITLTQTASNGLVKTWYDQSVTTQAGDTATGNHAVQATAASQPKIVSAGALVTSGLDFDGTDDRLEIDFGSNLSQPNSIVMVHQSSTTVDVKNEFFDELGATGQRTLLDQSSTNYRIFAGSSATTNLAVDTNKNLITAIYNGASSIVAKNGTAESALNGNTQSISSTSAIGFSESTAAYYQGAMQEFIVYNSDQTDNRTAIEANIGETYSITGIPAYDNTVDGFVDTWYDQSGNGRDAVQQTAANQPQIVNDGSLLSNGLTFAGIQSLSMPSSILSNINSLSCFLVCKGRSGFNYATALSISNGSGIKVALAEDTFGSFVNQYANSSTSLGTPDDAKHLISLVVGDSSAESFKDGTSKGTIATASGYGALGFIGHDPAMGTFWQDQVEEVIIYDSNQSANRVALETNIQTAYPTLP